ncbi:MAG: hypothetical protein CSA55_03425 [Ilumatobacter coccineus]|uniref:GerMN domain-containing protein n=1 Tax=Ilumatobacter coccineus TaxID=467094 RepID=A0A2G6KBM4_9ACTN|nr:MAG: hypothetical protein CSA55_03425 [Ilumatobacter coccineus]
MVAGCSLPIDDGVDTYNPRDLPDELVSETTTTTTTIATTTATDVPSATTEPEPNTQPIQIFYHLGFTDTLQPLELERAQPVPLSVVKDLLESPSGISEYGLRTSVRFGLIAEVTLARGVATVDLDPAVIERMTSIELRRAVAQIVLTYTSFRTADLGAIGQTRFTVDDGGFSVYVPSLGGSSEPGAPLAYEDFASLLETTPRDTAPAVTSAAPTTAAPTTAGDG